MIKLAKIFAATVFVSLAATSCIDEVTPQNDQPGAGQVATAPGAFDGQVTGLTSSLVGEFTYGGNTDTYPWDYGYPTFYLMRDYMGQDIVCEVGGNGWYNTWYAVGVSLGPSYRDSQIPWTYYYKWINNCNTVLRIAGAEPSADHLVGAGIAHAMRAMFYMDLARMFQFTYARDKLAPTVPIVTETTSLDAVTKNPRAPQETMWAFILSDLDKAEQYLADYDRADVTTPDLSVVYGFKARAYLTMENWAEAEKYAKLAQAGYTPMSKAEYTDRMTAFNMPNGSWMFGMTYNPSSPNILLNDSDSNWGSWMFLEVKGGLYASNYGNPNEIDAHLYQTIPATDFRKMCYLDPVLDEMEPAERTAMIVEKFSDYPHYLDVTVTQSNSKRYGYLPLKFRAAGGAAGRENPYVATAASVPMMRVEEMMLIEAEAAGMQDAARGKALLTTFALTRDPEYVYNELSTIQDNVWWQRRVELWGEGFATFDIKRLQKGITRSYAGTNHDTGYRWNTSEVPQWMNLCIVQTEAFYNFELGENNPTPIPPGEDSPEWVW